jgi:hypothetical protein
MAIIAAASSISRSPIVIEVIKDALVQIGKALAKLETETERGDTL